MQTFRQFITEQVSFKTAEELRKFVELTYPGVDLSVYDSTYGQETHVSMIEVPKQNQREGTGSKIMQMVCDYADQHGRILTLSPEHCGHGQPSKAKLTDWYRSFGFVPNKGRNKDFRFRCLMLRRPKH